MNYFYDERLDFKYPLEAAPENKQASELTENIKTRSARFLTKHPEVGDKTKELLKSFEQGMTNFIREDITSHTAKLFLNVFEDGIQLLLDDSLKKISKEDSAEMDALRKGQIKLQADLIELQKEHKTLSEKYMTLMEKQLSI